MTTAKREVQAASYVLMSCVLGVIIMRLIVYVLPIPSDTYEGNLISSAVFTIPTQLVFFLLVPFFIFKTSGKCTVRGVLNYSSLNRFEPYHLIAIPLGFAVYIITVYVSSVWTGILTFTGYTVSSGSPDMPQEFSAGLFAMEMLLTAVLPAVCEEFCMRGGMLTAARKRFNKYAVIVIFGLIFGLFHQNVRQVFYTALFGALATFLTIETKSLYPAMLMHFTNNALSVYFNYAAEYGFFGAGIRRLFAQPVWTVVAVFIAAIFVAVAAVMLILFLRDRKKFKQRKKQLEAMRNIPSYVKRVMNMKKPEPKPVTVVEKLSIADFAPFIALGAVTVLTTVFNYIWGFLY